MVENGVEHCISMLQLEEPPSVLVNDESSTKEVKGKTRKTFKKRRYIYESHDSDKNVLHEGRRSPKK